MKSTRHNKGFQATAHKLSLCDRLRTLQSYTVLTVVRRLNPDVLHVKIKRKWMLIILALLGLLIGFRLYRSYSSLDGFSGMIWGAILWEDTVYAQGYTEQGFCRVNVGMSEQQVYDLVGAPLDTWTNKDSSVSMRWSKSPGDTNFRCRVLEFVNGIVKDKHAEYYVD